MRGQMMAAWIMGSSSGDGEKETHRSNRGTRLGYSVWGWDR